MDEKRVVQYVLVGLEHRIQTKGLNRHSQSWLGRLLRTRWRGFNDSSGGKASARVFIGHLGITVHGRIPTESQ